MSRELAPLLAQDFKSPLNSHLGRQRQVQDGEERPQAQVQQRHKGAAKEDPVRVRIRAEGGDYGLPLPLEQPYHRRGQKQVGGEVTRGRLPPGAEGHGAPQTSLID